jgi:NADH-quinone oxidoreductase subunit L
MAYAGPHASKALWVVGVLGSICTSFYVGRFFFKTFHGPTRLDHHTFDHTHESAAPMAIPLILLAIGSLVVGLLAMPHFITHHQPFNEWMAPVFADVKHVAEGGEAEEGSALPIRLIGLYTAIIAWALWLTSRWFAKPNPRPQQVAERLSYLHAILWNKYYVDELYDLVFVRGLLGLSRWLLKWLDQGLVDGAVNACAWVSQKSSEFLRRRLSNGYARFYAASLLAGVVLLLLLALNYGGQAAVAPAPAAEAAQAPK